MASPPTRAGDGVWALQTSGALRVIFRENEALRVPKNQWSSSGTSKMNGTKHGLLKTMEALSGSFKGREALHKLRKDGSPWNARSREVPFLDELFTGHIQTGRFQRCEAGSR